MMLDSEELFREKLINSVDSDTLIDVLNLDPEVLVDTLWTEILKVRGRFYFLGDGEND